ncbi:MAG: hypothetical protein JWM86_493 [Thermoleophilia bacterium]|nr:hypothetical protein [Thermoleophilia bacterium]
MDDPDLWALRQFRAADAVPDDGLQARIEERVWQAILNEESEAARGRSGATGRPRRRWRDGLLRPALAATSALAVAAVVAVASDGGPTGVLTGGTGTTQAGTSLIEATATSLFGDDAAATSSARSGANGVVDLRSSGDDREALAEGPMPGTDGGLSPASGSFVAGAPRDPLALRAQLRAAAVDVAGSDPTDRIAFHLAMHWVVQPAVDVEVRSAMLRSVGGMTGLEPALAGTDLLGRDAVVIGHLDPMSGLREQYLLDPDNGRLLERRGMMTAYVDPACPPGTVTDHVVYDEAGSPVEPADAPWLAWPQVIDACGPRT